MNVELWLALKASSRVLLLGDMAVELNLISAKETVLFSSFQIIERDCVKQLIIYHINDVNERIRVAVTSFNNVAQLLVCVKT